MESHTHTHYEILGVSNRATPREIRDAYRRLVRCYHPDRSGDQGTAVLFQEVRAAYGVLKCDLKRARYDQSLIPETAHRRRQPTDSMRAVKHRHSGVKRRSATVSPGVDFGEVFRSVFTARSQSPRQGAVDGKDLRAIVSLELEAAHAGGAQSVSIPEAHMPGGSRRIEVQLPPGLTNGQTLRLPALGHPGVNGGKTGDLYLEIAIAEHPLFKVEGRDIYLRVPLAPWEAALGIRLTVPGIDRRFEITVPSQTRSGTRIRLSTKGLAGEPPGDLIVNLQIETPPADDESTASFYRQMAERFRSFNPRRW